MTEQIDIVNPQVFPAEREDQIRRLLVDAVDLHCHSGPAAMPRILDHHDAAMDCEAAGFKALVYKDHFYLGTNHCIMMEKLMPDLKVKLFSGIALNNACGGINPHAVDHAIRLGGKIVWMPTLSASNHIERNAKATKNFPSAVKPMVTAIPLSAVDANGNLTDETKQVLDLIAEGDIILAGGHLHVSEQFKMFEEAQARGVKKMIVNHPTFLIDCTDADITALASMGIYIEHSICMFIEGRAYKYSAERLVELIGLAGAEKTVLSSDLGLTGSPRPVEGYRRVLNKLLEQNVGEAQIRTMISENGSKLLDLA